MSTAKNSAPEELLDPGVEVVKEVATEAGKDVEPAEVVKDGPAEVEVEVAKEVAPEPEPAPEAPDDFDPDEDIDADIIGIDDLKSPAAFRLIWVRRRPRRWPGRLPPKRTVCRQTLPR